MPGIVLKRIAPEMQRLHSIERALYYEQGMTIIPSVIVNGKKVPLKGTPVREYLKRAQTEEEFLNFTAKEHEIFQVVCGPNSCLYALDIDSKHDPEAISRVKNIIPDTVWKKGYRQKTINEGLHFWIKSEIALPAINIKWNYLELKGFGRPALITTGKGYTKEIDSPDILHIPVLTAEEIELLLKALRSLPGQIQSKEAKDHTPGENELSRHLRREGNPPSAGERHNTLVQDAGIIRNWPISRLDQDSIIRNIGMWFGLDSSEIDSVINTTDWNPKDGFPEIEAVSDLLNCPPDPEPVLIDGILRAKHKLVISGPSKIGKTFMLMDLALSISTGRKWLDEFPTNKSPTLFVNLEVSRASFLHRLKAVADARMIPYSETKLLKTIHMRGLNICSEEYLSRFMDYLSAEQWGAIVLDPMYKLYPLEKGFEENKAESLIRMFNLIDKLIAGSGASVLMCTHTSKGVQGGKAAIDRASGSGVWARDPDAILSLVEANSEDGGYKLEFALREFASPAPIGLQFNYPVHLRDETLDKVEVKGQKRAGRIQAFTADMLSSVWAKKADENGFASFEDIRKHIGAGSQKTFSNRIAELNKTGKNIYNLRVCKNGINGDLSNLSKL